MKCKKENCFNEFEDKNNKLFCSKNCRTGFNIKKNKDKYYKAICPECGGNMHSTSLKCRDCNDETSKIKQMTIEEYQNRESVKNKHQSWKNHHIRNFAKSWNTHLKGLPCVNCGYSKHTEFCHIKAIKDFDPNSKLGEINDESNIIILCPNCHWEFDNNLLSL